MNMCYRLYQNTKDLDKIRKLIEDNLSEPYSSFTYHYFLHYFPQLCWLAVKEIDGEDLIQGVIMGRVGEHRGAKRGYIGMLAVETNIQGQGVGTLLARLIVESMINLAVDEIVLETQASNQAALALYQKLGFVRDKRLSSYYSDGSDAFRLKLWLS